MIIKEDVFTCSEVVYDGRLVSAVNISHKKVVERRNKHNAPEFDIEGVTYYVETMDVEYKTHEYHVMRAIIVKEAKDGQSIERFNLEVDYNANTMTLEEI